MFEMQRAPGALTHHDETHVLRTDIDAGGETLPALPHRLKPRIFIGHTALPLTHATNHSNASNEGSLSADARPNDIQPNG
ncbi:hypothetical protein OKW26_006627 [Paraburkholderia sp. 32]